MNAYGPFLTRAQAKAQGLKQYFDGKPCKHGHVDARLVSNWRCMECCRHAAAKQHMVASQDETFRAKKVETMRKWRENNPARRLELQRRVSQKRRLCPAERVKDSLSARLRTLLFNSAAVKAGQIERICGCTREQLAAHLEAKFTEGMSWDNYAEWHIDHIRPCASFDLTDETQQRECFHFSNLQPLWALDNLLKSDHWEAEAA